MRLDRQAGGLPPSPADCAQLPFVPPGTGVWEIRLDIGDGEHAIGTLCLQLDTCFERLLKNLSGRRDSARCPGGAGGNFRERLRVRLQARLLDREMALGDIMDLRPGSVLPVTLQARSEVLVGASRLFDADVAEQHGKLCLRPVLSPANDSTNTEQEGFSMDLNDDFDLGGVLDGLDALDGKPADDAAAPRRRRRAT